MSLRKSSRRRNGSVSAVFPNPNARRRRTPAPSTVGLDLMSRLTGRMDMSASRVVVRLPHVTLWDDARAGDVTSAANTATQTQLGVLDEWHLDLAFFLNLGKLGSYPVSPL